MIRTTFGLLALLALAPALPALDKPKTPTPAQQYKALVKEYNQAMAEHQKAWQEQLKAIREGKTPKDKIKAISMTNPLPEKFAPRFLELAEKNPKDPAAVDALVWVITYSSAGTGKSAPDTPRSKAAKILLRDHIRSEKMANVCQRLGYAQDDESQQILRAVLEKSPHRPVQAEACLALAKQAENQMRMARRFKSQPEMAKQYEAFLGKEAVEKLVKADADKLSKEAEKYFERIAKDFADVATPRGGTMGKIAEGKLEALRHPILVGKPAPEIVAEDIDGQKFKLSDYRGKVVLLDFWGHW